MSIVGGVLIAIGVGFMVIAGIGVLRFPDIFARMHAATKSASLGLACLLVGTALLLGQGATAVKLVLAVAFQFATAPVAAHVVGRAAYQTGTPLWEGSVFDDLAEERPI